MSDVNNDANAWPLARDLSARTFDHVSIIVHDLARTAMAAGEQMIVGRTFSDCRLEGPAVMLPVSGCSFDSTDFGYSSGDIRNLVLRPASPSKVIGAIAFKDCTFIGCRFFAVGYTGPEAFLQQLLTLRTQ